MQDGLLPLFPLQVVLLPGSQLPLHIFEERYKEMIGEVLRDKLEFGVILASSRGIVDTGCTGTVDRVLREYPDGRLDIMVRGRRRFEVLLLNEERSFLRGSVEFFDDDELNPDAPPDLLQDVISSFNELQSLSSSDPLDPEKAHDPQLSFRVAQDVLPHGRGHHGGGGGALRIQVREADAVRLQKVDPPRRAPGDVRDG